MKKDKRAMEETLRLPTEDLNRTSADAQGVLLESRFPDARINRGSERSLKTTKTGDTIDWHMARNVVTEDKVGRAVETFMPHKAPGPDGIYLICLQKGLDLIIKYLIKVYRGSIAMGQLLKLWRDVRVVLIHKSGRDLYACVLLL